MTKVHPEHTLEEGQTAALTSTPTSHQNHDINLDEYETPRWIRSTYQHMKHLAVVSKKAHPREAKRRKIDHLLAFPAAHQDDIVASSHLVLQDQHVQKMIRVDQSMTTHANETSAYLLKTRLSRKNQQPKDLGDGRKNAAFRSSFYHNSLKDFYREEAVDRDEVQRLQTKYVRQSLEIPQAPIPVDYGSWSGTNGQAKYEDGIYVSDSEE